MSDALFATSGEIGGAMGPIFTAEYESEDSCCGEGIQPGEDARSDGSGGWIHADDGCERIVAGRPRRNRSMPAQEPCPRCFLVHNGECY